MTGDGRRLSAPDPRTTFFWDKTAPERGPQKHTSATPRGSSPAAGASCGPGLKASHGAAPGSAVGAVWRKVLGGFFIFYFIYIFSSYVFIVREPLTEAELVLFSLKKCAQNGKKSMMRCEEKLTKTNKIEFVIFLCAQLSLVPLKIKVKNKLSCQKVGKLGVHISFR